MDNSDNDANPDNADNKFNLNIYSVRHALCIDDTRVMSHAFFQGNDRVPYLYTENRHPFTVNNDLFYILRKRFLFWKIP